MTKIYLTYNSSYDNFVDAFKDDNVLAYSNEQEMKNSVSNDYMTDDGNKVVFVVLDFNSKIIKTGKIEETKITKLIFDK